MSCCLNGVATVLDEDGDLSGSWRFENACELGNGLLENLGRTDVDLGYDDHDRDIQSQSDAEMFSYTDGQLSIVYKDVW